MEAAHFELVVDGNPYDVTAKPYSFNDETRFYVSYNGSDQYIFALDSDLKRFAAIEKEAVEMPEDVEEAIAARLQKIYS